MTTEDQTQGTTADDYEENIPEAPKPRSIIDILGKQQPDVPTPSNDDTDSDDVPDDDAADDDDTQVSGRVRDVNDPKELKKLYTSIEAEKSRQANELGELRGLVKEMLETDLQQRKSTIKDAPDQSEEIDWNDIPQAVGMLITKQNQPIIEAVQQLAVSVQLMQMNNKFGDISATVESQDFKDWVDDSEYRTKLFKKADKGDFDAMGELFKEWQTRSAEQQQQQQEKRDAPRRKARKAASPVGRSGSSGRSSGKIWTSAEIIHLKRTDKQKYLELQPEIMAAYRENRVR